MKRVLGVSILPEMLGLWAIETGVCFSVFSQALYASPLPARGSPPAIPGFAMAEALLLALTVGLVVSAVGLYRPSVCLEMRRLLLNTVICTTAALPAIWLVSSLCNVPLLQLFGGGLGWVHAVLTWTALMLGTRILYTLAVNHDLLTRRLAIVGAPPAADKMVEAIGGTRRWLFRIEAIHSPTGCSLAHLPDRLWGVVFTDQGAALDLPFRARSFDCESFWEDQLARIDIDATAQRGDTCTMFARAAKESRAAAVVRNGLDIVIALMLLLFTAPLLLATALLVRLESPGPVIYRQERVGLNGQTFTLFKFRSMRNDAEHSGPAWAMTRDPRVTAVGRFIRKVRIDELPQLFNILRGDMSMVGPRPERPHFVAQLAAVIPLYHERARVKPGLTGWAQVNYPYGATVEDARAKLSYDLYYIKHRSLAFDLMVLLATVRVILFQEGAR